MWNKFQYHSKDGPCGGMNLSSSLESKAQQIEPWQMGPAEKGGYE